MRTSPVVEFASSVEIHTSLSRRFAVRTLQLTGDQRSLVVSGALAV